MIATTRPATNIPNHSLNSSLPWTVAPRKAPKVGTWQPTEEQRADDERRPTERRGRRRRTRKRLPAASRHRARRTRGVARADTSDAAEGAASREMPAILATTRAPDRASILRTCGVFAPLANDAPGHPGDQARRSAAWRGALATSGVSIPAAIAADSSTPGSMATRPRRRGRPPSPLGLAVAGRPLHPHDQRRDRLGEHDPRVQVGVGENRGDDESRSDDDVAGVVQRAAETRDRTERPRGHDVQQEEPDAGGDEHDLGTASEVEADGDERDGNDVLGDLVAEEGDRGDPGAALGRSVNPIVRDRRYSLARPRSAAG